MSATTSTVIQLAGALLILLAFWANASGRWSRESRAYLWLNLFGSILLAIVAIVLRQPGFILMEVVWAGVSVLALWRGSRIEEFTPPLKEHTMAEDRARLLELVKTVALSRGHFILASGKESSYYLDGRLVTLSPEGAYLTGKLMYEHLKDLDVQAVGGLTMGADPVATAVAVVSYREGHPIPAFLVRKEAKGHGKQKQVEGPLPAGARVAIVEDTVTTGDSALQAIAAVEALGCTVVTVMALVDRLDGAGELLASKGYAFAPLFTVRDLGIDVA
jgi:orotate phosphoribosyltransferase